MKIKKVTVIGAGTMGNGIAHTFAQFNYDVNLVDINQEFINKGLSNISKNIDRQIKKGIFTEDRKNEILLRIKTSTDLSSAKDSDIVIEAATENPEVKFKIFRDN